MVLTIVIAILCLIAGIAAGIRIGSHFSALKLTTVREQLELQRQYSLEWSNAARNQNQLRNEISQHENSTLTTTMETVIHLLNSVGQQQGQALEKQERDKVEQLIQQAKSVTSP